MEDDLLSFSNSPVAVNDFDPFACEDSMKVLVPNVNVLQKSKQDSVDGLCVLNDGFSTEQISNDVQDAIMNTTSVDDKTRNDRLSFSMEKCANEVLSDQVEYKLDRNSHSIPIDHSDLLVQLEEVNTTIVNTTIVNKTVVNKTIVNTTIDQGDHSDESLNLELQNFSGLPVDKVDHSGEVINMEKVSVEASEGDGTNYSDADMEEVNRNADINQVGQSGETINVEEMNAGELNTDKVGQSDELFNMKVENASVGELSTDGANHNDADMEMENSSLGHMDEINESDGEGDANVGMEQSDDNVMEVKVDDVFGTRDSLDANVNHDTGRDIVSSLDDNEDVASSQHTKGTSVEECSGVDNTMDSDGSNFGDFTCHEDEFEDDPFGDFTSHDQTEKDDFESFSLEPSNKFELATKQLIDLCVEASLLNALDFSNLENQPEYTIEAETPNEPLPEFSMEPESIARFKSMVHTELPEKASTCQEVEFDLEKFNLEQCMVVYREKLNESVVSGVLHKDSKQYDSFSSILLHAPSIELLDEKLSDLQQVLLEHATSTAMLKLAQDAARTAQTALAVQANTTSRGLFRFGRKASIITDAVKQARDCDTSTMRIMTPKHKKNIKSEFPTDTKDSDSEGSLVSTKSESNDLEFFKAPLPTRTFLSRFTKLTSTRSSTKSKTHSIQICQHVPNPNIIQVTIDLTTLSGGFDELKWYCASKVYDEQTVLEIPPSKIEFYTHPKGKRLHSRQPRVMLNTVLKPNTTWSIKLQS